MTGENLDSSEDSRSSGLGSNLGFHENKVEVLMVRQGVGYLTTVSTLGYISSNGMKRLL